LALKLLAAVLEALIKTYAYKEEQKTSTDNKICVFVCERGTSTDKTNEITAVPISSTTSAATMRLQEFVIAIRSAVLCVKVFMCSQGCYVNGTFCICAQKSKIL
jgi:hypothetical protein